MGARDRHPTCGHKSRGRMGRRGQRARGHKVAAMLEGRNSSSASSGDGAFVLLGFAALPAAQRRLLAVPLCASYAWVLLGNWALVLVIVRVRALHSPMYLLVGALCGVDVLAASAIAPKALLGLLRERDAISLAGCLAQMFFTHFLSSVESTLLLAMALDRYVAVCRPLRYARIMDGSMLAGLLLFTLLRSGAVMAALVGLAAPLRFCGPRLIRHCYCDHMALVSLACGDTRRNAAAGLAVIVCFVGVDVSLIALSYGRILAVVLRAGGPERWKALHTCGTHLMVMLCFYLVGSLAFLSHSLRVRVPPHANTAMGLVYILLPAAVNPLIYGARTREIQNGFRRVFRGRGGGGGTRLRVSPAGKRAAGPLGSGESRAVRSHAVCAPALSK